MRETDQQIQKLYSQYKAGKLQTEQSTQKSLPIIGKVIQTLRGRRNFGEERRVTEQIGYQISELLRDQPGNYPLARLNYISHMTGSGFVYGFDYNLGEDLFTVNYWSYNRWGILVQKHPADYSPEIEIVERTVEPTEEELEEDPDVGTYTTIDRLLHLPEGFRIPVGPLHFESDSLPISERELEADKQLAINMAEAAGIKVNKETLEMAEKMMGPRRKYPGRYFYWQPILPDTPTIIAIDFDSIEPKHMGITLEGAPVFNNTIVIPEEEY